MSGNENSQELAKSFYAVVDVKGNLILQSDEESEIDLDKKLDSKDVVFNTFTSRTCTTRY